MSTRLIHPSKPTLLNLSEKNAIRNITSSSRLSNVDFSNCVVTGGYVVNCILSSEWDTDVDIFLYDLTESQATEKISSLVKSIVGEDRVDIIRTQDTITFIVNDMKYQIILRLYDSINDVLDSFDLDCCAVGYDGEQIVWTRRSITSINNRTINVDTSRFTESFNLRLLKYFNRGFDILIPKIFWLKNGVNSVSGLHIHVLEKVDDNTYVVNMTLKDFNRVSAIYKEATKKDVINDLINGRHTGVINTDIDEVLKGNSYVSEYDILSKVSYDLKKFQGFLNVPTTIITNHLLSLPDPSFQKWLDGVSSPKSRGPVVYEDCRFTVTPITIDDWLAN